MGILCCVILSLLVILLHSMLDVIQNLPVSCLYHIGSFTISQMYGAGVGQHIV